MLELLYSCCEFTWQKIVIIIVAISIIVVVVVVIAIIVIIIVIITTSSARSRLWLNLLQVTRPTSEFACAGPHARVSTCADSRPHA